MSALPSMRRPVNVKGHVVGQVSYLLFSFARIAEVFWPARSIVKAERSEFILSLDCGRAGDIEVDPGEDGSKSGPFSLAHRPRFRVFSVATLPSALWCERSIARCKLGVLDSAGAATCYCDLHSILLTECWARAMTQSPELGL
jgi:hypothetical protein